MSVSDVRRPYVLGLDLGVASIGWARVECDPGDSFKPLSLLGAGSHLFESGTEGTMSDISKGKDEARNVQRRTARLMRRQTWRRARRKRVLLKTLIRLNLLPEPHTLGLSISGDLRRPLDIDSYMKAIDKGLMERWTALRAAIGSASDVHTDQQRMPVIIDPADVGVWLDAGTTGPALSALMRPCPDGMLKAVRVPSAVNSPRHDSPDCIAPVAE